MSDAVKAKIAGACRNRSCGLGEVSVNDRAAGQGGILGGITLEQMWTNKLKVYEI